MEESINMNRTELITMSPLVLAYLGDTVFESHIREYLITKNINKNTAIQVKKGTTPTNPLEYMSKYNELMN